MILKYLRILPLALLAFSLIATGNSLASERYGKQKVVYHINYDNPKSRPAPCETFRTISMLLAQRILISRSYCMATAWRCCSSRTHFQN